MPICSVMSQSRLSDDDSEAAEPSSGRSAGQTPSARFSRKVERLDIEKTAWHAVAAGLMLEEPMIRKPMRMRLKDEERRLEEVKRKAIENGRSEERRTAKYLLEQGQAALDLINESLSREEPLIAASRDGLI